MTTPPSRSITSAWRRETVASSSTTSALGRRPMRVSAAEAGDDDVVAVGDGEVAAGGEPPDGGSGGADAVEDGAGPQDGRGRLGGGSCRLARDQDGHGRTFPDEPKESPRGS